MRKISSYHFGLISRNQEPVSGVGAGSACALSFSVRERLTQKEEVV